MTEFFKHEYYIKAKKQRKIVLAIFFIVLAVYLAGSGGILGWYLTLPYKSPTISTIKAIQYTITAVFIIFFFIYMRICYARVNKYFKQCGYLIDGIKEESDGYFFEYNDTLVTKDGVDMKTLIFLQWNKFKSNYYERKVFVFYEVDFPVFKENQKVKLVTVGNVLHSYEILDDGEMGEKEIEE